MKNYKPINFFSFLFFITTFVASAQSYYGMLNSKKIESQNEDSKAIENNESENKPLPYEYINEKDILWSKVVWETIDLYQRQNYKLYYPISEEQSLANTKSLFTILLENIRSGKITEVYDNSYFSNKLPIAEIEKKLVKIDTANYGYDLLNEGETNISEYIDKSTIKPQDIQAYQVKGMWYFNKITAQLNYRLLAIAPMAPDIQTMGRDDIEDNETYPLFWVFYPDAREILHNKFAIKDGFVAQPESYDYILSSRDFSSVITREQNMFGDRKINEYIKDNSLFQLREAERIKEEIRNLESDMWVY